MTIDMNHPDAKGLSELVEALQPLHFEMLKIARFAADERVQDMETSVARLSLQACDTEPAPAAAKATPARELVAECMRMAYSSALNNRPYPPPWLAAADAVMSLFPSPETFGAGYAMDLTFLAKQHALQTARKEAAEARVVELEGELAISKAQAIQCLDEIYEVNSVLGRSTMKSPGPSAKHVATRCAELAAAQAEVARLARQVLELRTTARAALGLRGYTGAHAALALGHLRALVDEEQFPRKEVVRTFTTQEEVDEYFGKGAFPDVLPRAQDVVKPSGIPMLLTCPACSARHIDEGEFATKVHHTHSCQKCGHTWRPAVVATVGVQFLPGFKNAEASSAVGLAAKNGGVL